MLKSRDYTLNTMCNIICSPAFPGYFPAILAAVRSNMFAPVSVQTQCTSIFFPTPRGPAIRTDLTSGDFSCTAWDPARQIAEKDRNVKIQPISLQAIIFASDQELALKGKVCSGTISYQAARGLNLLRISSEMIFKSRGTQRQTGSSCRYLCHKTNKGTKKQSSPGVLLFGCIVSFVVRYQCLGTYRKKLTDKKREYFVPSSHMDFPVLSRVNDDRTFYSLRHA